LQRLAEQRRELLLLEAGGEVLDLRGAGVDVGELG
jgi:hypothetical protein